LVVDVLLAHTPLHAPLREHIVFQQANGSAFVYFGMKPVDINSPEAKVLIPYVRGVLDAMGIKHGPSHGEVMMTEEGPCLVEMNCRAHGGDGNWRPLCKGLTGGYSQVEATVDAYLDPKQFAKLPDRPPSPFKASGQEVILVSHSRGKVKSTPGYDVVKALPSFLCLETGIKPGVEVDYTVDLLTGIGSVILMHPDPKVLERDIDFIRYLEEINGLFVYETKLENLKRPRGEQVVLDTILSHGVDKEKAHRRVFSSEGPSLIRHMSNDRPELRGPMMMKRMTTVDASKEVVVLVDPYSTGCCVAEEILKRGYRVIALWTKGFNPEMKTHVPLSVGRIEYLREVEEAGSLEETSSAVYKAAGEYRVVACLAGGEAGVDLADALSEKMNLRTNGTRIPNKRDKKLQQELIKKQGLRSVRQACGTKFSEVEGFLKKESYPLVLKPVESAGSDGVKLCHNFDEAKEHFHILMDSQMVNGGDCPAVLCQEFLRGKEYVVDHVSRDGIHKCVAVWVYDKRPANGNAFVYFGCVPVDSSSTEAKILISYTRRVLDALDIKNGPSHAEIMMTNDGPCLVEMNCRAHGGDGNWRPLWVALNGGYSQVETTVDAYLESRAFQITPDRPPSPFKAHGQEVILVSFSRGKVKSTPGFEKIQKLPSFVYLETGVRPGSHVDYTIDLFTGIGSVILMHPDEEVLNRDVETIRNMEKENLLLEYEKPEIHFRGSAATHNTVKDLVVASDRPELY
jgi:biotin carboxylase